jgi:hypothetical protein
MVNSENDLVDRRALQTQPVFAWAARQGKHWGRAHQGRGYLRSSVVGNSVDRSSGGAATNPGVCP